MNTVSYTVRLPIAAQKKLFEMAKQYGYLPSHFVQLLFDAAYAARCGIERGDEASDRELDEMVRAVFCLAGQFDAAVIGRAIGADDALVGRILDAWREEAGRVGRPMRKAAAVAHPSPSATSGPAKPDRVLLSSPTGGEEGASSRRTAKKNQAGVGKAKVLAALSEHADGEGRVALGQGELAKACGISKDTVQYHIHKLSREGAIRLVKTGNRFGPSMYQITEGATA